MATSVVGMKSWEGERDDEGHRTYMTTYRVMGATTDGPAAVMTTAGLPLVGSLWLVSSDFDLWAWCTPYMKVRPEPATKEGNPTRYWLVDMKFTTKPTTTDRSGDSGGGGGSNPSGVQDPLFEPQKVSGSFVKYTEEATKDRFGNPILTSSHEQIRGPQNEWDANRPKVRVEQNVPLLQAELWAPMIDTLNDSSLWGLDARCWKLSDVTWERKYHGNFDTYYTRSFEFDANANTFDRDILDEGTKALHGEWNTTTGEYEVSTVIGFSLVTPDYTNPQHFIRFKDIHGDPCRVLLNGYGRPISGNDGTGTLDAAGRIHVERYGESNFLLLGIPSTI